MDKRPAIASHLERVPRMSAISPRGKNSAPFPPPLVLSDVTSPGIKHLLVFTARSFVGRTRFSRQTGTFTRREKATPHDSAISPRDEKTNVSLVAYVFAGAIRGK